MLKFQFYSLITKVNAHNIRCIPWLFLIAYVACHDVIITLVFHSLNFVSNFIHSICNTAFAVIQGFLLLLLLKFFKYPFKSSSSSDALWLLRKHTVRPVAQSSTYRELTYEVFKHSWHNRLWRCPFSFTVVVWCAFLLALLHLPFKLGRRASTVILVPHAQKDAILEKRETGGPKGGVSCLFEVCLDFFH